jgi:hypothetical protein
MKELSTTIGPSPFLTLVVLSRGPCNRKHIPLPRTESITARFYLPNKQVKCPSCQWRGDAYLRLEDRSHPLSPLPRRDPCDRHFNCAAPTSTSERSLLDPCTGFELMGAYASSRPASSASTTTHIQVYANTPDVSRRLNPVTHRRIAFCPTDVCGITSGHSSRARKC